jgi:hypothetical protein
MAGDKNTGHRNTCCGVPNTTIIAPSGPLAVQLRLESVGVFIADVNFIAIECQRPGLGFAVVQYPAFDLKNVLAQPTSPGGIDSAK